MGILDKFSLEGRIALVSGGAGAMFGSSISEALAEAGATVVTASRSLERNREFAERMKGEGFDVHPMQLDITEPDSIEALRVGVMEQFGRVDVLVNSSVVGRGGGFEDQTAEYWEYSAQGNMVGLMAMCRGFIPEMVEQGRGSVINISSIYGVVGNDPTLYEGTDMKQPPDYTFVKGGMINYTRYLANYFGKKGVRANCLCPGGYYSEQPGPFLDNYNKRCPMGRMLENDDIKGAVVFLASDASQYITGVHLMVDGGWTSL
ncbi:MAG: SDR family oxidoreductase [Gemmatimonadetes bacterium]|jgi:NAD(P)-dependent dehydrogenase (short-subunit alcohol dehydrogenase family)|nr:SDR family oxidoreductase [Gemmatimonadota bacterium]